MPTIKDVAREAGVSIATVSYVLNNKLDAVSEETRQQVWEAVQRIGYTPNITARNLRSSQSRLIGYAWHEVPADQINSVLDRFIYHLAREAEARGYHILTFTFPSADPTPIYDDLIRSGRVDAFVLSGTVFNDPRIDFLLERGAPFVSFGRSNEMHRFPFVDTDGAAGTRRAVDYLARLGHRRIGYAGWDERSLAGTHRRAGYLEGMRGLGLAVGHAWMTVGAHSEQSGRDSLEAWLRLPADRRPTAVITASDLMAIGVINAAEQHGMQVPADLSVIGFDDMPVAPYLRPALTTLRQPIPRIATEIIAILDALLNRIERPRTQLLLPPELIVRESCAAPPQE
jgi:DNA-binding LacI/PurR family transcriptional regulator